MTEDPSPPSADMPAGTGTRVASVGLASKLLAIGCVFLVLALASIGLTLWVTWQLEGGAAAVNEAGRLRMSMVRMAMARQNEARSRAPMARPTSASTAKAKPSSK